MTELARFVGAVRRAALRRARWARTAWRASPRSQRSTAERRREIALALVSELTPVQRHSSRHHQAPRSGRHTEAVLGTVLGYDAGK